MRLKIGSVVMTPNGRGVVVTRESFTASGNGVIEDKNPLRWVSNPRWGVSLDKKSLGQPDPAYYSPDKLKATR